MQAGSGHVQGDEIVHIVAGETAIQLLVDGERQTLQVSAGDLLVVPQAHGIDCSPKRELPS